MKRIQLHVAILAIAATQMGATDCGQVLRDPGFDLWCGEELCTWKLVRGEIARVGTWHESDSGVSFLGTDSAIQQLASVNSSDSNCLRFTLVSDVEDTAEAFLRIDLEADGTVERAERIPTSRWQPIEFLIHIEGPYDGIRFELAKSGIGRAVLANVGAELAGGECTGIIPITPGPRPNGAACFDNAHCASGICASSTTPTSSAAIFGMVCAGCRDSTTCDPGEVCGLGDPLSPVLAVPAECVPVGAKALAEQCADDAECASGICTKLDAEQDGVCSSCEGTADCGGQACGYSWIESIDGVAGQACVDDFECASGTCVAELPGTIGVCVILPELCLGPDCPEAATPRPGPRVCGAGTGAGATGAPCGADADCASGTCAGSERRTCDDGRACQTPADCPITEGLAPGPCTTVGIQGGTCT